jgi:predicted MFS family arabinose efflux permease
MPIILYNADHTPKEAQYLTIPVYGAAGVTTIAVGYLSDRYRKRGIFLVGCYAVATVGWVLLIATRNPNVNYAGTFLVGMGSMPTVILQLAWLNVNIIGYTKK